MALIKADWPAPDNIISLISTRNEGHSLPPYHSNNLAFHVGDDERLVSKNRCLLNKLLPKDSQVEWLEQTHSTEVVIAEHTSYRKADALITRQANTFLAIMTADCLPIIVCNESGNEIANIHAGWRGLLNGVIHNTINKMESPPHHLLAYIGPSICKQCYEVGYEVKEAFDSQFNFASKAFKAKESKWLADMPLLAEHVLHSLGVLKVYHSHLCTFESADTFFSYRRENQTGRIATLIGFQ